MKSKTSSKTPSIWLAISPIIIIFALNLFFSKVYYPNVDGTYLESFNTTLDSMSGTWSVIISIAIAILFILLLNIKKLKNLQSILDTGVKNFIYSPFKLKCYCRLWKYHQNTSYFPWNSNHDFKPFTESNYC